jgi:hypothetical protein
MTKQKAEKVMREMERAGFNTQLRHWFSDESYDVIAIDSATGIRIEIHTVEQWEERKQAIAFSREYDA